MRAIVCEEFGKPEVLKLRDIPPVDPKPGQLRVRVHAASVNFPDGLMIANKYQAKMTLPFVPGSECAGVVDAIGDGVAGFAIGDRVAAFGGTGAFAEQMVVQANRAVKLNDSVSFEAAAAATVTYGTTIYALRTRGQLKPGETLLVLGAGGGVGSAAVEVGKLLGAKIIAGASSAEKLAVAKSYGADHLINYREQDLRESLRPFTGANAIDVVYDPIGGDFSEAAFRSIGWNGRFLVIGFAVGKIPALPMNLPLLKSGSVIGVFWGASIEHEPEGFKRDVTDLFAWLADGTLKPHIGKRYKLENAAQAVDDLMTGNATGKLIIEVG